MARHLTLHDPKAAQSYYAQGLWREDTLFSLAQHWAEQRPDAVAVRDPWRALTWSQLITEAEAVSAALHADGVKQGDRVSIWMGNRVEAVVIFLACSRCGFVFNTSIHQSYTVEEVIALLTRVRTRALFAEIGFGADADAHNIFDIAGSLEAMRAVYALDNRSGRAPYQQRAKVYPQHMETPPPAIVDDPDKLVYLAFTSGTTGAPKGVMHSDNSLLANGRAMVADWQHDEHTILVCLSSMSHHIGTVALEQALVGGFELALADPRSGLNMVDWIERAQGTYVMGVPTHAIDILADLQKRNQKKLGDVRIFYMAGAPIAQELAQRLVAMGITPQNVYGMTENGSHQYTVPHDPVETIIGTCGKSCAAYEVALFSPDDRNQLVAIGEIGEIGGRGAMRMLGYFDNQTATEDSLNDDGWFMSGDLGRMTADANLEIVGRSKDIIIRGGHNIHPAKIEDLSMRHPHILKAAVVGIKDARLGERAGLIVIQSGAEQPDGDDVLNHLHEHGLSPFDMPEYFAVVESLPLGPTGKVLKRELITQITAGHISPTAVRWAKKKEALS